jgi:hypothetical protein
MTRTLILEDFGAATTPPEPTSYGCSIEELTSRPEQPDADPDPAGLDAFEQGYQSGWDDCIANEQKNGAGLAPIWPGPCRKCHLPPRRHSVSSWLLSRP